MTEGTGAKDPFTDEEPARGHDLFGMGERERQAVLAWVGENLTQVRRSVYEQRLLHWSLGPASWLAWPFMSVAMRCDRR